MEKIIEKRIVNNAGSSFFILEEYEDYMLLLRLSDNLPVIAQGYNGESWNHGTYGKLGLSPEEQAKQLSEMTELFMIKSGITKENKIEKGKGR